MCLKIWQLCPQRSLAESLHHFRASRELSQPVLCLVGWRKMQMGCWQGVEEGASKGHFVSLPLVTRDSSGCTVTYLCLLSLSLSSSSGLSSFPFCLCVSPTFLTLSFHASLFFSRWISHLLPTLPYVSKFSPVLFLPSRHTWGWNWATSLTPSAISGDYCNAVCIHLCFFLPSQSFVVIFFFILLWLNRWWWTTFRHIRECRSNLKCSVFYQTRGMGLF